MDKLTNNMDKPTNQERMRIFTIWKDREQKMPVSFDEMCRLLWANGLTHTAGYFHYTTIDRFEKMWNGMVPLGEELKLKLFFLSAAEALNDGYESSPALARRLFIGSFTIGVEEEVSMWTNYGVPKRGAIRLRFPRKALNAWKKAYDQNRLRLFGVREKGAEALSKDLVECIDFCDVAYLGRNDARMGGVDRLVYRGETNRLCEDTWRSRLSECLDFRRALFKKRGWAYEREVRLVVLLNKQLPEGYEKIAVDFTDPIEAVLKDVQKNVMLGPWYNWESRLLNAQKAEIPISTFCGELRMRSVCDQCDKKSRSECKCEFAEWKSNQELH